MPARRFRLALLLLAGLFAVSTTSPCLHAESPRINQATKKKEKKVARLVQRYHDACKSGDMEKAKKIARKAIEIDPGCFAPMDGNSRLSGQSEGLRKHPQVWGPYDYTSSFDCGECEGALWSQMFWEKVVDIARKMGCAGVKSDPTLRMEQLLNQSEDLRELQYEWARFWYTDQPSHMTYDRIHGGIE